MAITFKGERTVAELNNNLGGFVKDSAFRIYDHGILLKGNVPVKHGDFVSWTGTQWKIESGLEYATSADVEAIEERVEALGQPLQWKGPATVAELNAGITGIQPGWTYTLTDAGTLTGSIVVDVGDEVAWTEDGEWFKVGGDGGKIELFDVRYNQQTSDYVWPTYADIDAVVTAGKLAALKVTNPAGYVEYYWLTNRPIGTGNSYTFYGGEENSKYVRIYFSGIAPKVGFNIKNTDQRAIAPMYSTTSTYAVNDAVMHDGIRYVCNTAITQAEDWNSGHWTQKSVEEEIGNVETLLAAL